MRCSGEKPNTKCFTMDLGNRLITGISRKSYVLIHSYFSISSGNEIIIIDPSPNFLTCYNLPL
jgi:hypothetical protein